MEGQLSLSLGIAFVGATLGYMVGGSASPVIGVAMPVIFGLVVTAIGLMQASQPNKEIFELLKADGERAESLPEIVDYRNRVKLAPRRIGISLTVFSVAFLVAATLGAKVRIENLLVSTPAAHAFPWATSQTKPPTIDAALDWIALQARLHELGYNDNHINELYELQVHDWKSQANAHQSSASPEKSGNTSSTDDLLKQWFTKPGVKGNPFAIQPPRDLTDKLKELRQPGVVLNKGMPG